MLAKNLSALRRLRQMTQEEVAERVGVTRQALARWESGESVPDVQRCKLLAEVYGVSLDSLVNYSEEESGLLIPPKGCHIFGMVKVGEKGQIVIPQAARKVFRIQPGDHLIVLGDEAQGLALVKESDLLALFHELQAAPKEDAP